MNERIKQVRLSLGLSQEEFGKKLGVGRGAITNIELNKVEPKPLFVSLICQQYGISETWLRTGEGEMYRAQSEDDELEKIFAEVGASDDALIKAILKAYWKLDEKEKAAIRKLIDDLLEHYKKENPGD